jgi:hypothetical protein
VHESELSSFEKGILLGAILANNASSLEKLAAPAKERCQAAFSEFSAQPNAERRRAIRQLTQEVFRAQQKKGELK